MTTTKKTFEVDSIGIEFEFSLDYPRDFIFDKAVSLLEEYNKTSDVFTIQVDREYYEDQIEFKLMRTPHIKEGIEYFQNFLIMMYETFPGIHATCKNHFVGTHIHTFIKKDGEEYTKFAQGKKPSLVRMTYGMMAEWLLNWRSHGITQSNAKNELNRLTRNHNILRYFDGSIGNLLMRNLEKYRMNYQQFHNGTDRPKYTPVLWSLPNTTTGKTHSLEVRCIPNSFFLCSTPMDVAKLVEGVEDVLNKKGEPDADAEIEVIAQLHERLIKELINL